MAVPPITPLPPAPSRSQGQAAFNLYADPFIAALPPFALQANALGAAINTAAQQVAADALYAGQAADRAEAVDTNVGEQVAAATAAANNAAASATAAEAAPGSIGNLALIQAMALLF